MHKNMLKIVFITLCMLYTHTPSCDAERDCEGAAVEVNAFFPNETVAVYGYPALFGPALNNTATSHALLKEVVPKDACASVEESSFPGAAALVPRGNCSFSDKAIHLEQAGYKYMLLYNNDEGCVLMSGSSNATAGEPGITAISITEEAGQLLKQLVADVGLIALRAPYLPRVDILSAVALWLMAVCTLVTGSLWSAYELRTEKLIPTHHAEEVKFKTTESNSDVTTITSTGALLFIGVASAMLMMMYFFSNSWFVLLLVALFAIGAWQSLSYLMLVILSNVLPKKLSEPHLTVPLLGPATVLSLFSGTFAALVSVTWFIGRHTHWAWALQDVMGVSLMLIILQQLQLPNLKVASVLLPLAFVYDVWWVFLQPVVTGGDSVMIAVASGGRAEQLPMLLKFPRTSLGNNVSYSMLGFGDIILPGLLASFACRFDARKSLSLMKGYFLPVAVGYGLGLVLTYVALLFNIGGSQGQPALLYLVPCTLGCMAFLSWWRGEFLDLWLYMDKVTVDRDRQSEEGEDEVSSNHVQERLEDEQEPMLGHTSSSVV